MFTRFYFENNVESIHGVMKQISKLNTNRVMESVVLEFKLNLMEFHIMSYSGY